VRANTITGTILGVEQRTEQLPENRTTTTEYLNLLTPEGLQSIPLAQIQRIKLLNDSLQAELRQALETLATGHDTQKKTVAITFDGQGKRKVSIAYIAQTPVWKTSYRLVLDEKEAPLLQGWAIVENTSDEDWDKVNLSLVSGRPISFTMDLYQPLYASRPVVQPELYSSLRPPVYGDSLQERESLIAGARPESLALSSAAPAPATASAPKAGRTLARSAGVALADANALPTDRAYFSFQSGGGSGAQGAVTGELFQYSIKTPVSLARQKSAMLPIVNQSVEGQKVSIYNESVQAKHPLNGFRLKNTTPLHLMQGPITVFDDGTYAGDARMEDLAAGQDRLLSYAMDIKTEVQPQHGDGQQELMSVKIRKGTLVATRRATETKTYTVRNRDQKKKTVLIEHPFRSDWKLVEPKEAAERTRDVYRFAVAVEPEKTSKLVVREDKPITEMVQLTDSAPDIIALYTRSKTVSPKIKQAMEKAVTLRDRLGRTIQERANREQRVNDITQEQARIRENMAKLNQSSELYNRYVKKLDQQENDLDALRKEIENLRATELKQQQELNDYLLNLDLE
jgi:hypothetical protein